MVRLIDGRRGDGGAGYPDVVSVEVTSVCNLRCRMCALTTGETRSGRNPGHMSAGTRRALLDIATRVGKLNFSGWGENFTDPGFLPLLEDLEALGVRFNVNTNGTYLTPEVVDRLSGLSNLFQINISIDSPVPAVYEEIRGVPLEKVLAGVRRLADGMGPPDRVTVSSVVMPDNARSLLPFPPLLEELGVRGYFLQGLIDFGEEGPLGRGRLEPGVAECVQEIKADCEARGINVYVLSYLRSHILDLPPHIWGELPADLVRAMQEAGEGLPETRMCLSPWDHIFINRDGDVMPCCICPTWESGLEEGRGILGNINEADFDDIWFGEGFTSLKRALLNGPTPPMCGACPVTSVGVHFFNLLDAEIDFEASRTRGTSVHLVARNMGRAAWTRDTLLHVGTSQDRDRLSGVHHPTWLHEQRVTGFEQERVEPGGRADFHLRVSEDGWGEGPEVFQLVADNICWLPGTQFEVRRRSSVGGRTRLRLLPWPHA